MTITIRGKSSVFQSPMTLDQIIGIMLPEEKEKIFACFSNGDVIELNATIDKSLELTPITYIEEEGRRIFERSLRFVLLLAARELYPDYSMRFEHSIGQGVYIEMEGLRLSPADVAALEGMMWDYVRRDLPFVKERWSRREAINYFMEQGDLDKANLLSFRPYDYFNIYTCDGLSEYFYGAMLPSTGMLKAFALYRRAPGFVMLLPDRENPEEASDFVSLPKHMAIFHQSNYWCKVLNCNTAADLNNLITENKLRDFIRVNEAFHSKVLSEIAEDIVARGARVIFIAGPSSSGKTTFANRLSIHLRVNGMKPLILSMDDFYRNRDELPLEPNGQPDLEALNALDVPYLREAIKSLLSGQETEMPRFNFTTQRREKETVTMKISANSPLIIEGIHGLNPELHEGIDPSLICRIYISQLTTINLDNHNRIRTTDARLLRRIVRDYQFRATPPLKTLEMWDSVRKGEEKWIFPYQENADIVFNSALHYELAVLKAMSFDILSQVPHNSPHFIKCNRILKILNYILPADRETFDEIPPLSILREFIGGNTLYENHRE
ncbi:MAG: nucleoside kinase [Bacillota bacterium]|nr:nucleoside kinase [Bacillota bacterium]